MSIRLMFLYINPLNHQYVVIGFTLGMLGFKKPHEVYFNIYSQNNVY